MKKRIWVSILVIVIVFFFSICQGKGMAQELKKILSIEAFDMLNTVPDTYLIDIRTRAEYQFVGHPIGAFLFPYMFMTHDIQNKDELCTYRYDNLNPDFIKEISKVFQKENNLIIIGRDGTRSALAAKALVDAGFKHIYDVTDGFEGAPFPSFEDSNKNKFYRQLARRNKIYGFNLRRYYGWQSWGLPWHYDMDPKNIYPPDLSPSEE